jgi:hypothetical protein
MTPENRVDVEVEVQVDTTWYPGVLHHWQQRDGRWEGWASWSTETGEHRLGWFDEDQLREV